MRVLSWRPWIRPPIARLHPRAAWPSTAYPGNHTRNVAKTVWDRESPPDRRLSSPVIIRTVRWSYSQKVYRELSLGIQQSFAEMQ